MQTKFALPLAVALLISNTQAIKSKFGFGGAEFGAQVSAKMNSAPESKPEQAANPAPVAKPVDKPQGIESVNGTESEGAGYYLRYKKPVYHKPCCPECPCEEEFEAANEQLDANIDLVGDLSSLQETQGGLIDNIAANQQTQLTTIGDIQNDVSEMVQILTDVQNAPGSGQPECDVTLSVNGQERPLEVLDTVDHICELCCEQPPVVDPPGNPDVDLCLADDNTLVDGTSYQFKQTIPEKTCPADYFIFSAAVNFAEGSSLDGTMHGYLTEEAFNNDELAQAAGSIKLSSKVDDYTEFEFDNEVATFAALGGG